MESTLSEELTFTEEEKDYIVNLFLSSIYDMERVETSPIYERILEPTFIHPEAPRFQLQVAPIEIYLNSDMSYKLLTKIAKQLGKTKV